MSFRHQNSISLARFERRNDVSVSTSAALSNAVTSEHGWVRIYNKTGQTVFVRAVDTAVAAGSVTTANGMPIGDGELEWLKVQKGQRIAAITSTGTGTLYVTEHGL